MATLRDSDVFEFCENYFEELKKQDNGYFPHIHDSLVMNEAAIKFSISIDEVNEKYYSLKIAITN